ncbi:MAG: thiamine phosphate synthase [Chloroflexota bacterium]
MTAPDSRLILRIIDANLNRTAEGLRVLEDVARFVLDDAVLTRQLKTMRHELAGDEWTSQQELLESRSADSDVGSSIEVPGAEKRRELPSLVVANSRRVQQSLRVLEELAKTAGPIAGLSADSLQKNRFAVYDIEKSTLSRLLRRDKIERLSGLYVVIDTQALGSRSHVAVAAEAIGGGARVIQLRDKLLSPRELLPLSLKLRGLCRECGVLFIVNDYLDLALAADADGVHLGQTDLPVSVARRLLPMGKIIGCSVCTVKQALAAQSEGADYIAVGCIYPTLSKTSAREPARVVGLDVLRKVRQKVSLPLVAIGGITGENAVEVIASGADTVAIISAVVKAKDVRAAARQIVEKIGAHHEEING